MMRIVDVDDTRYQIISEITSTDQEFIDKLRKFYDERYSDFVLLRPVGGGTQLICRRIDVADYEEITEES